MEIKKFEAYRYKGPTLRKIDRKNFLYLSLSKGVGSSGYANATTCKKVQADFPQTLGL